MTTRRRSFSRLSFLSRWLAALSLNAGGAERAEGRLGLEARPTDRIRGVIVRSPARLRTRWPFRVKSSPSCRARTVRAKGHDGVESQYEGVSLVEILAKAGVPTGKDLRGPAMATYVVVEACRRLSCRLRAGGAGPGVHRSGHPAGQPPRRQAPLGQGWAIPDHRPGREEACALGQAGDQAADWAGVNRDIAFGVWVN